MVLLEIGFWSRLEDLEEQREQHIPDDSYEFRPYVIANVVDSLSFTCGDVYANVVKKSLMVDTRDSEVAYASQRESCARIAADLSECRA